MSVSVYVKRYAHHWATLLTLTVVLFATNADAGPSDQIAIGYRLGWTLSSPKYKVVALDKAIENLASTPKGPETKALLDRLVRISDSTRNSELSALRAGRGQLKEMGAPVGCYTSVSKAIESLSHPLDTHATAEISRETDPQILRIMATLDESDSLLPKSWGRIVIWLKLTHSANAVWGFHLAELSRSLQAAAAGSADIAALELVFELRKQRPDNCPIAVVNALDLLDRKMNHSEVNLEVENEVAIAIEQAYREPTY